MEEEKKNKWPWHVPSREEELKYKQQLQIFIEKVNMFCSRSSGTWDEVEMEYNLNKSENFPRVIEENETTSSSVVQKALADLLCRRMGKNSELGKSKAANLTSGFGSEHSMVNELDDGGHEHAQKSKARRNKIKRGKPVFKKSWMTIQGELYSSSKGFKCNKCEKMYSAVWTLATHFGAVHFPKRYKYEVARRVHMGECQGLVLAAGYFNIGPSSFENAWKEKF